MLRIIEHTPTRLVLRDDRRIQRAAAFLFTALSALSVTLLLLQAYQRTSPALAMFVLIEVGFVTLGLFMLTHRVTVILDKGVETVTIHRRSTTIRQSIYGVSGLSVETNDEASLYGVYLVLRSGERIPLASLPQHDREHVEAMVRTVRAFLR
jgi:hypothetical protein